MMAGFHIRASHLKLIAGSHVRNSLRSGSGVIFLVLAMLVGLILAAIAVLPIEASMKGRTDSADAAVFNEVVSKIGPKVLDFIGTPPSQNDFLLHDKPALISLFLILLFVFLPFLSALAGFNQTAGDIGTRGLRYLLLRTERANIYLGRMLGTYLFTLAVITVIVAVVGLYVIIKVKFYPTGDVVLWMLRGWFVAALYVMPWVALCAWISAAIPMPFLSLLVSAGGLAFWVIIGWIMKSKMAELGYASYVTPWGYKWWLFDASIATMLLGIVVVLAFTAVFILLGLRTFNNRDV
jgi:ABC-type transport system involved in multi-copper enzyme maturation permease subunit